jgi:2-polyprenyl-3-methyl-5-hydroxy-6-metoxy-1,4-benzoquinol methylase
MDNGHRMQRHSGPEFHPAADARSADEQAGVREEIASLFRGRLRGYARIKLRHDPVYGVVATQLRRFAAPVLDSGCGIGLLGLYLRAHGFRGRYLGIDCDPAKVAAARRSAQRHAPPLAFAESDVGELPVFSGAVVLLDVLHYLDADQQQALLRAAAARIAVGAALIVRTVLREPRWRYLATVCEEHLLYGVGWMRMPARHFPHRAEIETTLRAHGLQTHTRPLWGATPFASFLIVARRLA